MKFFGRFTISGVTCDAAGAPLASCRVDLLESATKAQLQTTTSDGAGAFSFSLGGNAGFYQVIAYKPGTPDVAGISADTLVAA